MCEWEYTKVEGKYSLNSGDSFKIEKVSLKVLCLMYIASVEIAKSGSPVILSSVLLSSKDTLFIDL